MRADLRTSPLRLIWCSPWVTFYQGYVDIASGFVSFWCPSRQQLSTLFKHLAMSLGKKYNPQAYLNTPDCSVFKSWWRFHIIIWHGYVLNGQICGISSGNTLNWYVILSHTSWGKLKHERCVATIILMLEFSLWIHFVNLRCDSLRRRSYPISNFKRTSWNHLSTQWFITKIPRFVIWCIFSIYLLRPQINIVRRYCNVYSRWSKLEYKICVRDGGRCLVFSPLLRKFWRVREQYANWGLFDLSYRTNCELCVWDRYKAEQEPLCSYCSSWGICWPHCLHNRVLQSQQVPKNQSSSYCHATWCYSSNARM